MGNKEILLNCLQSIACIETCLLSLCEVGINVEPGDNKNTFGTALYGAASGPNAIIASLLDVPEGKEEDTVYNMINICNLENYKEVAEELWEKYGRK